ncbi:hypothetical protein HPB50_007432 [Hyalomma asiaticum]|uniref:Uncharacterized protein n=1 Tax=Hyalomma asiaticum TaxID=266040 RepID=A0ACB7TDS7_HYAAI|nr:hypothetical protein HPB50_007432 [Hyalomma asiaticum]
MDTRTTRDPDQDAPGLGPRGVGPLDTDSAACSAPAWQRRSRLEVVRWYDYAIVRSVMVQIISREVLEGCDAGFFIF